MQEVTCHRCGHKWATKSMARRVCCANPRCRTSVTLQRKIAVKISQYKLSYKLWKDARFTQRMQNLPSLGEEYVTLRADDNGNLSL